MLFCMVIFKKYVVGMLFNINIFVCGLVGNWFVRCRFVWILLLKFLYMVWNVGNLVCWLRGIVDILFVVVFVM